MSARLSKRRLKAAQIYATIEPIVINQSDCVISAHLVAEARAVTFNIWAILTAFGRQPLLLFISQSNLDILDALLFYSANQISVF